MAAKGLFIVFEGIDGAGCETQSKLLQKKLKGSVLFRYPDCTDPYGRLIKKYLEGKCRIHPEKIFMTFALNQMKDREKIGKLLEAGKIVVSDRYITSNFAYQCNGALPIDKALKFAEMFEFPKPDLIFYLDIKPEMAMERKRREKTLDIYESDLKKQRNVRKKYLNLVLNHVWSHNWVLVNGEEKIETINKKIMDEVLKMV